MLHCSNLYTLTTAHIGDGLHPINRPINCWYSLLSYMKNKLTRTKSNILYTSTSFKPRRSSESINTHLYIIINAAFDA